MNFTEAENLARKWVSTSNTRFELAESDPPEKRLTFVDGSGGDQSFYVVGPNEDGGAMFWHVWSDHDDTLSRLQPVIESLQSCQKKSLMEILQQINRVLAVTQGAAAMVDAEEDDGIDDDYSDDEDDDDVGYDDDYYAGDDPDVAENTAANSRTTEETEEDEMYTKTGNPTAVKRLLKDWKNVKAAEKFNISACPRGDDLFIWDVKLLDFPKNTKLGRDLIEFAKKCHSEPVIYLEMSFPQDYPMAPPFVRIIRPRFQFLTGHITVGGSICMELLTKSGWRPTNDIENLLIQIRAEIMSDPKAQLDHRNMNSPYDKTEATRAFHRMVTKYGWDK